jgi:pimeloyl-[acyl-carrier protein] methyl ester esterase
VKAKPLVFLHGWAMTPAIWQAMAAALDDEASDIRMPALPGHGTDTTRPRNSLAAWAEALAPALPRDAILIGWSLGALLALELARVRPQQVARLVLIGSTPRFVASPDWPHGLDEKTVQGFIEGHARDPAATLRRFLALQTLGEDARNHLLRKLSETVCTPRDGQAHQTLADGLHILATTDLRASLAAIGQPVCLIHGNGDALMPPAAARWLADALPRARLHMLAHRGHALPVSACDECVAAIRAHLRADFD